MTTATALRCYCGKLHTAAHITVTTRCTCGLLLWPQIVGPKR